MPSLDVSELLTDPDFCQQATVMRTTVAVDSHGRGQPTVVSQTITVVLVGISGAELDRRGGDAERDSGTIRLWTQFPLVDGNGAITADIIVWRGRSHTVTNVESFLDYGMGFVEAEAKLLSLTNTPDATQ